MCRWVKLLLKHLVLSAALHDALARSRLLALTAWHTHSQLWYTSAMADIHGAWQRADHWHVSLLQENPDEVCPAGWKPGDETMKPDPKVSWQ